MPPGPVRATRPPSLVALAALAALGIGCRPSGPPASGQGGDAAPRAATPDRRFDASLVPAYAGSHPGAYGWIDAHLTTHLANVRRWTRQRSVGTDRAGARRMASMLRDDLRRLGFREAELVETAGNPAVWGYYDAHADRSLVVWLSYDVAAADSTAWSVPPFGGALVDRAAGRALVVRGAAGAKAAGRAFLNALEAIIRSEGTLPVNVMLLAGGEREQGSPHLGDVIDRYADRLRGAIGVLVPWSLQDSAGTVSAFLGANGLLTVELTARGAPATGGAAGPAPAGTDAAGDGTAGSFAVATDSSRWRLAQALACLTSREGDTITVPGWYDAIRPPTPEEERLIDGLIEPRGRAVESPTPEADGIDAQDAQDARTSLAARLFSTTLTIDAVRVGDADPSRGSAPPHEATATLRARLVPDQDPERALALIRRHLDAEGFRDVSARRVSGYPAAQVPDTTSIVRATLSVYNKYSLRTSVAPRDRESAPFALFTTRLGLPLVAAGLGHGGKADAPDEYLVVTPAKGGAVAGLREIEKGYVDLVHAIATSP